MKNLGKIIRQRHKKILDYLNTVDSATVSDLSAELGVSEITIRRDLNVFFENGTIERFHGGARLIKKNLEESGFEEKGTLHSKEKDAIGQQASLLVSDGETIFVNAGSTTLSLLKHLSNRKIRIITNNAAAPGIITAETTMELILVGGEYRHTSRSLFGGIALAAISQIHASRCFLGTNGISARYGITTSVHPEAAINRLMVDQCMGTVIVIADGSKIGVVSNFSSLPISAIHILVTDESADPTALQAISDAGVEVIIASAAGDED
ncbi:DeoR/GlpR family DNA-binding transcription regulator [Breznakiella homolactica]|uniref:DeoR/GlpR transcriptional regulator n=1 Tax=Breznakiella homolactica TaxID=2798577 RepID=A0A7T7XJY1_9SPIR|nr:DeoR/GlpR family DNA-binding transcription regulator [Breznakiella homolactica]QQO07741.1 DeoR/GlpR family DNA-binding transcription regulator [Breznakiella homolactica]